MCLAESVPSSSFFFFYHLSLSLCFLSLRCTSSLSHWFTLSLSDLWFPVFSHCKESWEQEAPARQPPYSIRQKFFPILSLCKRITRQLVSIDGAVRSSICCDLDFWLYEWRHRMVTTLHLMLHQHVDDWTTRAHRNSAANTAKIWEWQWTLSRHN